MTDMPDLVYCLAFIAVVSFLFCFKSSSFFGALLFLPVIYSFINS
jgi:hypothetical protein